MFFLLSFVITRSSLYEVELLVPAELLAKLNKASCYCDATTGSCCLKSSLANVVVIRTKLNTLIINQLLLTLLEKLTSHTNTESNHPQAYSTIIEFLMKNKHVMFQRGGLAHTHTPTVTALHSSDSNSSCTASNGIKNTCMDFRWPGSSRSLCIRAHYLLV